MSLKAVFFDLDGTLLPMDMDLFIKSYFGAISQKLAPHGYEPKELINVIWQGTKAMITNDGSRTNEEVFWDSFISFYGKDRLKDTVYFDKFYEENFDGLKSVCGYNPKSAETVNALKEKGLRLILATNPLFPSIATEKRISFAGLKTEDFEFFTSYENISYCKPNVKYYEEVLKRTGLKPHQCLMVGNDADDDMIAQTLGLKVFLLTDCLINNSGSDVSNYPQGSFSELMAYIDTLL